MMVAIPPKNTILGKLLGRLAKGSVIGVDAILKCFGERKRQWAKVLTKRIR
ncbi:MAG: hypothetical protein AAGJ82_06710 [Bacteroidota bacterium]